MEFLFLKCSGKFMDTVSHGETSLLGKFYMHQENNAPFMTKNVNFAFFPWTLLGHSKKTLADTNVRAPNNNLSKTLDNPQRDSDIKDLTEKSKSNLLALIKLRKRNPNNPNIIYLNINSLREKIISLREICLTSSIDILCVDETKLDASYPNAQFHIERYQFPPFRRDRNKHSGRNMVFLRNGLERKESETICIEVTISKKKWCIKFANRSPQNDNIVMFFNELNLSLNQCVNKSDNNIVMGDLNIDISDKRKDNNNFLSDLCDTFSLQNIISEKNCHKSNVGTSIDIMLTNRPRSFHKTSIFETGISDHH